MRPVRAPVMLVWQHRLEFAKFKRRMRAETGQFGHACDRITPPPLVRNHLCSGVVGRSRIGLKSVKHHRVVAMPCPRKIEVSRRSRT